MLRNKRWALSAVLGILCLAANGQEKIMTLNSSNAAVSWKVKAAAELGQTTDIHATAYNDQQWVKGIVPGTVFGSFVAAGLEKDPNYADNIYQVDKAKYDRDFWYRSTFKFSRRKAGEQQWLNFEGVNRKAEVFLNGHRLGLLDGFMDRGKFDVTNLLRYDQPNVLALLVSWPGTPIVNYSSPTYISSASWDWMPYVPGLNMGITDDVYITGSGAITIQDPWVRTSAADTSLAKLSISMELDNHSAQAQEGTISGTIQPGNIRFSKNVKLSAGQTEQVSFQPEIAHPALWWPNGYGSQPLYTCDLQFTVKDSVSDSHNVTFGVRRFSYDTTGGVLHIYINGQKIFIKGGNWGMSEYLLRCRGSEYDTKLKLHREMNFNMVRNWIGSTTDEEFYTACDRYGLLVWDDFWLNSHPNLPKDIFAFNRNAVEKIKRLRNHASIAVWCGDNEGYPLPPLNNWLKEDVSTFDGNDRLYQANSHADGLTGSGPWTNFAPAWYFTRFPGGFGGTPGWGLRTEIGTAVFPSFESFKQFMPDSSWWPRNKMWDLHFFGPSAANAGPDRYDEAINKGYGTASGIEDYCRKAQLVNIEVNKAMYEGWLHNMWKDASGIMTWMSQSAYPSMVWQTYDYYYDLTGAYWGVKKACEPLHIQWSAADNSVKVVNTTLQDYSNLKAEAIVYNMDGTIAKQIGQTATVRAAANNTTPCFDLNFNADNLAFRKTVVASSSSPESAGTAAAADGSVGSRWSSNYNDNEWIYVDLGVAQEISNVVLIWEDAHAAAYNLQVSDDAQSWTDVYKTETSKGGTETIALQAVKARYVRMLGRKRASQWGYSLYELEVYGKRSATLSEVQFIRLRLSDAKGSLQSDNFYWRGNRNGDYTALNQLPAVQLKVGSKAVQVSDSTRITATVSNPSNAAGPAFAVCVQVVRADNNERVLPLVMSDNYFTLLKGESKQLEISFEKRLLESGKYKLIVTPYNHK
ncbi:galactose-binding domain-containing protein [Chitinophaga pinensis]|uniref:Coagulation factor 5/8 type domain protein n=1 Tax=Chitinophaga pinensis (strain ATCC 43595 / DSM 2588 / LMG 13176 / NBRC 15968 / NCIMB 11800 / UQM 2034) TaxID=485918 RepID=A0A979G7K0_CHIPD|nr:discoidin domain-containing protein [Chitinophaga pinensis]ACU62245.1 coagulation factor 5/8 type domain protein [Chitinophaga pinensis DSM 2588]